MSTFITVAIPYVNSTPHLGYAFELIEADLAATARRQLGEPVRFLGGTDDYSLKNVLAAEAAGEPTQEFVDRHAHRFEALAGPLGISFDERERLPPGRHELIDVPEDVGEFEVGEPRLARAEDGALPTDLKVHFGKAETVGRCEHRLDPLLTLGCGAFCNEDARREVLAPSDPAP